MFTGIVAGTFEVVSVQRRQAGIQLGLALTAELTDGLTLGASVCVDGVCLTVVSMEAQAAYFDVIAETLERSTLGALQAGDRVNVERSCRFGDEIGGHVVGGHVIGTATLSERVDSDERYRLQVSVPEDWMNYIHEKGFIAIDGCSLTVGKCSRASGRGRFDLHLIPETLRRTTLGAKDVGDRVNVELDSSEVAIVATVERVLSARRAASGER